MCKDSLFVDGGLGRFGTRWSIQLRRTSNHEGHSWHSWDMGQMRSKMHLQPVPPVGEEGRHSSPSCHSRSAHGISLNATCSYRRSGGRLPDHCGRLSTVYLPVS